MKLIHDDVESGRYSPELAHLADQLTTQVLQQPLF